VGRTEVGRDVTPEGLASAAAILLAGLFAVAAVAKTVRHAATVESFRSLGLVGPEALGWLVPAGELFTAGLLIVVPVAGAGASVLLLVAFSVVLVRALRSGLAVDCACFGAIADGQISPLDVVRNVGLIALAHLALFAPSPVVVEAVALGFVAVVMLIAAFTLRSARGRLASLAGE